MTKTEIKSSLSKAGKKIGSGMTRFAQFKWVQVIKDSALVQMPFMLIGSVFLITQAIAQMSISDYANSSLGTGMFNTFMSMGNALSFGLASLIAAFAMGYFAAKIVKPTKMKIIPINSGILAMILFIVLTSVVTLVPASGSNLAHYSWSMTTSFFNARGFFTAIIAAVLSHYIMYLFYMYRIGIRLPKSVPEFVTNAFNIVLVGIVVVSLGVGVVHLLALGNTSMNNVMSKAFDFLTNIAASWGGMYVTAFFIMLAWFFGIHGGVTVQSIVAPTWTAALAMNQSGGQMIFAQGFKDFYMNAGGLASILGLAILMALFAKSQRLKAIGRSSVVPAIFNISEPMVFGTPLIYNMHTIIPFFTIPMVNITIGGLFSMNSWFAAIPTIQVHWAIPAPIQAYLGTLSWQAAIVSAGIILTSILIWFPFFKKYDKVLVKEEQTNKKSKSTIASEERAAGMKQQKLDNKKAVESKKAGSSTSSTKSSSNEETKKRLAEAIKKRNASK